MKQYKTLENWNGYEKGAIVPENVASRLLDNYMYFEDQSILEVVEVSDKEVKIEAPKSEVTNTVKKTSKKTTKKS